MKKIYKILQLTMKTFKKNYIQVNWNWINLLKLYFFFFFFFFFLENFIKLLRFIN